MQIRTAGGMGGGSCDAPRIPMGGTFYWVIVTVTGPIVMKPVRRFGALRLATENVTVPEVAEEAPEVIVIQEALVLAFQAQPVLAVT